MPIAGLRREAPQATTEKIPPQNRMKPKLLPLLLFCMLAWTGISRADYHHFNVASGSDIVTQEVRYPYWEGGTYNAIWSNYVLSSDGPSEYFYGGIVTSAPPTYNQWVHWPPGSPLHSGDNPTVIFSGQNMFSKRTAFSEGSSAKVSGYWPLALNQWYRFVIRYWQPADGTPHVGYAGQWMRDSSTGIWYHLATLQYPFAATGIDGAGGFQEDFNGNTNNRRTDYRNCYYRKAGVWSAANQFTCSTRNANEAANAALIESNTAVYFEINQGGTYTPYMMGIGPSADMTLTMTGQPAAQTFDPVVVNNATASVIGSQVLVQWQIPATSSPQLSYKIEVFNNSSYTGTAAVTVYDHDPELRQKLVNIPGVSTPYVRLTISDIFDNSAAPVLITPTAATLQPATAVSGTVSGLGYQYYEAASGVQWTAIPSFTSLTPALSGAVNWLDLTPRRRRTNYAFNYTGYIQSPTDGLYTFTLTSSHGSSLSIDGNVVVSNDGVHDILAATGTVGLKAGLHAINVQYFFASQNGDTPDSDSMSLSYQGPGIGPVTVPNSAYFRVPSGSEPGIVLNSPANGATTYGANLQWNATATANGTTPNSVQFFVGDEYWGQSTTAPYSLNSLLWAAPNNQLRARLYYNGNKSIDSAVNLVTTQNVDLTPWQLSALGAHNFPVGAAVQGATCSLVGDSLNFLYRQVSGDCTVIAHLADITSSGALPDGSTADGNAEAGIILRNSLSALPGTPLGDNGSTEFQALFSRVDGTTHYQDGTMSNGGGPYPSGDLGGSNRWYKIQRVGNTFTGSVSPDGVNWTVATTQTLPSMGTVLYVGLYTFTWQSLIPVVHHAAFDNISITGTVLGAPSVTITPGTMSAYAGTAVTFNSAVVGAGPYSYQWYCNGTAISGATNATLTLPSAQLSDSGLYSVTVTTANGTATSNSASLSVLTPITTGYAATTLAGSPVAYWRLGETSGTLADDSAGNYNGTYSNVTLGGNGPQPPSYVGFEANNTAAQFNGSSSSVSLPALNLNSNTVTISGWVKRSGSQASWAGIFFCRSGSTAVGLHFGTANELRYTWNNASNTYNWNSGLVPPDGQWTYVALAVQPTKATIYMSTASGLSSATNTVSHAVQAFAGTAYLGQDPNGGRWFNGMLDEVAVYNQTLSTTALQSQYQAASASMPAVTLTSPASGAGYTAPATISLAATAAYTGHTVTAVKFYNGSTLLGQATASPYSYAWTNVPQGAYTVYAQAVFNDGNTMSSAPAFVTATNPPVAPTSVSATALGSNLVDVAWSAVPGATSYIISRNGVVIATVTGTNYLDSGLTAGTGYSYSVIASDQWGNSPASSTVSATTLSSGTVLVWDADNVTPGAQDGNGNWGASYSNWLSGSTDLAWPDAVQAAFGAGAATGGTVTIASDVTPSGVIFTSGGYNIAGGAGALNLSGSVTFNCLQDGGVSSTVKGSGALVKTGPGTLTLSGTNSFTGAATVSAGTLQLTNTTLAGSVADNSALVFNETGSVSYGGALSGTGSVTLLGSGTLTLNRTTANTYSGGTTISGGMLSVGSGGSSNTSSTGALGTGQVTLNGGGTLRLWIRTSSTFTIANGLLFNGGTLRAEDGTYTLSSPITVGSSGAIQTQYGGKPLTFSNSVSGSGSLTLDNANNAYGSTYLILSADNSSFTGSLTTNVASSGWNGGLVSINHNNALRNANLIQNTPRDIMFGSGITAPVIGSLAGSGNATIPAGVTLDVEYNNASTTYSGALLGAGALSKVGVGTLTLSGANTYTGTTAVSAGTLQLSGSLGTGAVTVGSVGTLSGNGTVAGPVTVSGTLSPGSSSALGALNVTNNLSIGGTVALRLSKSGATLTNDSVTGIGTMTYGGTLSVTNVGSTALAVGDSFTLFSATSYSGSFATVMLPTLPSSMQWDQSQLSVNGSISVISSPLAAWMSQQFTAQQMGNASVSGLNAAPAGDGIANLMKFALGLNPMTPSSLPITTDVETISGSRYLRITINRNAGATDVAFVVEVAGSPGGSWTSSGTTIETNTATQLVVRDNTPLTGATARFIHLKVTHP